MYLFSLPEKVKAEISAIPLLHWFKDKDVFLKNFSEEEVQHALNCIGVTRQHLYNKETTGWISKHPDSINIVMDHKREPIYEAGKVVRYKDTYEVITRSQFQQNENERLLRCLLYIRFPWFCEFDWSIYVTCEAGKEIYMNTDKGTLYVPLTALLEKDAQAIEERMTSYFTDYWKHTPEKITESLAPLESEDYKKLKQYLRRVSWTRS